jgi:hypothetical protein
MTLNLNFTRRKLLSSYLCIICILASSLTAYSQNPSATSQNTQTIKFLNSQDKRIYEISLVEYEMLANRNPSELKLDVKARLLFTLERLASIACSTNTSKENVKTADCEKFYQELKKLHSLNPIAQCIKYGINSEMCKDSYNKQYLMNLPTSSDDLIKLIDDYQVKLWSASNKNIQLDYDLHDAITKYNQKPNQKNKLKVHAHYKKKLANSCEKTSLFITEDKPPKEYLINYVEPVKKDDQLEKLISDYGKNKDKENEAKKDLIDAEDYSAFRKKEDSDEVKKDVKPKKFWRVRFISSDCRYNIKDVLQFDASFPEAHCIKEGFYSPACLIAKDKFNQNSSNNKGNTKKPSLGLSTF